MGSARTPDPAWAAPLARLRERVLERGVPFERWVVLVPYPAWAPAARQAWMWRHPDGFAPRFLTPRQWADTLQPWRPGADDLSLDPARDALVGARWLDRVVRERLEPALRRELVARLLEAARELAPLAAAQPPAGRMAWAARRREGLGGAAGAGLAAGPRWEGLVAQLALTWVGASAFATDALWSERAAPGADADGLLVLPGHEPGALVQALLSRWGPRGATLDWGAAPAPAAPPRVWACDGFEAEASAAASCVIDHLNDGRVPVALLATDRLLTRRISALLQAAGVRLHDETGWKLSTTQAAAALMALLRAADARASADEVLDWLKLAPAFDAAAVAALEAVLRRLGVGRWSAVPPEPRLPEADAVLLALRAPRPLVAWLRDLATALQRSGQWAALQADGAGAQVLSVLRLGDAAHEFEALAEEDGARRRWSLSDLSAWVREVLEGASFQPVVAGEPQVIVLPLPQRRGRAVAAVVVPGGDERHLPLAPEPGGAWTAEQRAWLGLPDRAALRAGADSAWGALLDGTPMDVLWRHQDAGEVLLPSPRIEAWPGEPASRRWPGVAVGAGTPAPPQPSAPALLPARVSASAYDDLRTCPYRFFALRLLRLREAEELEAEPDARDLGNWLHAVLNAFHAARGDERPGEAADRAALDACAERAAAELGLSGEATDGGFLPYRAQWPALREGYLRWLAGHEALGARFVAAEADREVRAGRWTLHGRLDRIDTRPAEVGEEPVLIDYKTEGRARTEARVKRPLEDTQLAFYAALMGAPRLQAGYLSLSGTPGEGARWYAQPDIEAARDALLQGLAHDLDRVAAGAALPALGEGQACEYCAARGLCRRDDRS